jgi:NADH dehydrogenase (ubiquinone) 1 beta subcomplex subunit 8
VKRQFRDPHADWWDKQERRNYGEPVHEDNDILGMFSPEEYTHTKPGKGLFQIGCFVAVVFGLCGIVAMTYPDKPSAPREFEGGLERELGGPNAVRVSGIHQLMRKTSNSRYRRELLAMSKWTM